MAAGSVIASPSSFSAQVADASWRVLELVSAGVGVALLRRYETKIKRCWESLLQQVHFRRRSKKRISAKNAIDYLLPSAGRAGNLEIHAPGD
jgi:hypothetical protein